MMRSATLRLVLLVSAAHAMVHVYENSLPGVEQEIASEYHGEDKDAGKEMTGQLSTCWRLPWGLGALVAGWLVDRFGSRRMLTIYLLGCAATCALVAATQAVSLLYLGMLSMGLLASIYHPAGLTLISHETDPTNRPRALGLHGILGSAGIALAPFAAYGVLTADYDWRTYYWLLMAPGLVLGLVFAWQVKVHASANQKADQAAKDDPVDGNNPVITDEQEHAAWGAFFTLTVLALLQGVIYSAVMTFLPRYLNDFAADQSDSFAGKKLAAGVLLLGCIGQYISGRTARPKTLERQLTLITLGNAPLLVWMAVAGGWHRPLAAGLFAVVHFMHQPIYNSLIAKYTPRSRRSLCYGFSFAMGLGVGSVGALLAGLTRNDLLIYGSLAAVAVLAAILGAVLWYGQRDAAE